MQLDKPNCRACDIVLEELEHIDDECDIYGIQMVKIQDIPLAKRYGIKTFPALMYFRNGNPLLFDGNYTCMSIIFHRVFSLCQHQIQWMRRKVNNRTEVKSSFAMHLKAFWDDEQKLEHFCMKSAMVMFTVIIGSLGNE